MQTSTDRTRSFGEAHDLTAADRLGIWLSRRQIERYIPTFQGKRIADIGCGYQARFTRSVLNQVRSAVVVDLSLSDDLRQLPNVTAIQGALPGALEAIPDRSLDAIICVNVLEHLWQPDEAARHFHRILDTGGVCYVNVPSWRGKVFLETLAFRLKMTSAAEIDDHKRYYQPRDLWQTLVSAGFKPSQVTCGAYKAGLNVFGVGRRVD